MNHLSSTRDSYCRIPMQDLISTAESTASRVLQGICNPRAYDDSLEWPFKLKHKIQVLDHDVPGEDLFSRVWDPKELCSGWNWRKPDPLGDNYECVGLGFPQDTIYSRNYLHNNSITVKLTVFLDV
ncbi:hypothetical protein Anas_02421 [Armadillidium nasatum]|uniref:Uncharacterized protein n=1 Tax=Armadillidium nasatum TaxID=96803 RepID=A0A5N5SXV0_9CRUS|nr:hypothetical protein Anas_02421 [Armadillidium nasatum]